MAQYKKLYEMAEENAKYDTAPLAASCRNYVARAIAILDEIEKQFHEKLDNADVPLQRINAMNMLREIINEFKQ